MVHKTSGGIALAGLAATLGTAAYIADGGGTPGLWALLGLSVLLLLAGAFGWFTSPESVMPGQSTKKTKGDAAETTGDASPVLQGQGNVMSFNQSGGITAGAVHFGRQQRTLGAVPVSLVDRLKAHAGTSFKTNNSNDGETVRYEDEIKQLLVAAGWVSAGGGFIMRVPPVRGLWIFASDEAMPAAKQLKACLNELGLQAGITAKRVNDGGSHRGEVDSAVEITVGL